ncbi:N-6 DNA methylase [Candidatus Mycoplasma pogonae]
MSNNNSEKLLKIQDLEKELWSAADALRGNISSEQYMLIIIGIMCLKKISDDFNNAVKKIKNDKELNLENIDLEFIKENMDLLSEYGAYFFVPEKANWDYVSNFATDSSIGQKISEAFTLIENENRSLNGLFEKNYSREDLDQNKLGKVISVFSNVETSKYGEDILGRTYEYFLGEFFRKQGQKGGEFYTPKSVVDLMVRIIEPKENSDIYDPCCGTGGMLLQCKQFLEENNKSTIGVNFYGQEYQNNTWKIAKINLLLNGVNFEAVKLGDYSADTFTNDLHVTKKDFDYILANPPFNVKEWSQEQLINDKRWKWGVPPKGNANFGWISHIVYKLGEKGKAAVVLANGAVSSSKKEEKEIKKNLIKDNKLEAIISLPDKLFYTTGIPATIWFFNNNKKTDNILLIDASKMGTLIKKSLKELTNLDIEKIKHVYDQFVETGNVNEKEFAKTVSKKEVEENDFVLVPGRYIENLEEKINEEELYAEITELSNEIKSLFVEIVNEIPEVEKTIDKFLQKNKKGVR